MLQELLEVLSVIAHLKLKPGVLPGKEEDTVNDMLPGVRDQAREARAHIEAVTGITVTQLRMSA